MTPDMFADAMRGLVEAGASIVGGCCGTTPEHIRALTEAVKSMPVHKPLEHHRRVLASERKNVEIDLDGNFTVSERESILQVRKSCRHSFVRESLTWCARWLWSRRQMVREYLISIWA